MYDESYNQTGLSKIGQFLTTKKEKDPESTVLIELKKYQEFKNTYSFKRDYNGSIVLTDIRD